MCSDTKDLIQQLDEEIERKLFKWFRHLPVPAQKADDFFILMNEAYKAQVKDYEYGQKGRIDQVAVRHFSEALQRYNLKCMGHPVIAAFGASRDSAVVPEIVELLNILGEESVKLGLGLSTGCWDHGYMGVYRNAWLDARERHPKHKSFMADTPLMDEDANASDSTAGKADAVSPPHATLELRLPMIAGAPENMLSLVVEGGPGSLEEVARDKLAQQMAARSWLTYYSYRNGVVPPMVFIDQYDDGIVCENCEVLAPDLRPEDCQDCFDSTGWAHDWVLEKALADMRWKTCDRVVWEDTYIVRVGTPDKPRRKNNPVTVVWCDSNTQAVEFIIKLAAVHYTRYRQSLLDAFDANGDTPENTLTA